jgi:hypothetical protein
LTNLNWKSLVKDIQRALDFFDSQGVKPTLRTLYYQLVSQNLIPNTKTSYQSLSKQLVTLRKNGTFSMTILEDKVRMSYRNFADSAFDGNHEQYERERLDQALENFDVEAILKDFFNYRVSQATASKWANQPEVCEIWIEKDALASTVVNWTENRHVTVRVNKGYSSLTFIYNNSLALKELLENHNHVTILYLGDLDPSGCDMERYLKETLEELGCDSSDVELKRLGLTVDQVEKYNLPPKPEDADTLAKLERDPRNKNYTLDYVVELDSLVAYVPTEFKQLLLEAIDELWDQGIYDDLRDQADQINERLAEYLEEIKEKAKSKMRDF